MKEKNNINKILILIVSIAGMLLLVGSSYALFSSILFGDKTHVMKTGTLIITFLNESNAISLNNAIPISDAEGLETTPYNFTIKNTGTLNANYKITLEEVKYSTAEHNDADKAFPANSLKYSLAKNSEAPVIKNLNVDNFATYGTLSANGEVSYTLKLWININAGNEAQGKHYHGKIVVEAIQESEMFPTKLSDAVVDNLGDTGTTYKAEDGSTYIRGESNVVNNYVWYSGMMWRVYRINSDGSVKVIMDDNASALPFHNKNGSNVYETSHMKTWLNTYFWERLNTSKTTVLKQNNEFCIDSVVDADKDTSKRETCTNKLADQKIGLLTLDEYNIIENGSNSNYLNNGLWYWTMTPNTSDASFGGVVDSYGYSLSDVVSSANGSRAVVLFANAITIGGGNGSQGNPYKITGDVAKATSGTKLNTRYSGELISYNNKLFRIMEVSNGLTKVVYDGEAKITPDGIFGSNNLDWTTMKTRLEGSGISKSKLAIDQIWQRGYMDSGNDVLTTSLANGNEVTSTFGLSKTGEMWASLNNTKTTNYAKYTNQIYWTMTPPMSPPSDREWLVNSEGRAIDRSELNFSYGSRAVFFFRNDITIDGGSGTPESPYTLN